MARIPMRGRRWSDALVSKYEQENICAFLEHFENVAQKHEQRRIKLKKDEDAESEKSAPEYRITFGEKPSGITLKEYQLLYIETLYTIKHQIGSKTSKYHQEENDLYAYAQEAFGFSTDEHLRLLEKAREEKPPILILNVEVVEAKDLEAKDANGFSDPYCMLGIVPDPQRSTLTRQMSTGAVVSSDDEGANESKLGFMQRLKSLRKSTIRRNQNKEKNSPTTTHAALRDQKLPAKFIQTTDVKRTTLNPSWMEKFRFFLDISKNETFHLDIWDHDDEFSVFEAARKLNQVQGFKGLNRYFKQIAQSARTPSDENSNVDDFLGSVNIKINEIPSTGIDQWFSLEGRSEQSKVRGQIHLRANLATREDRGISEEDNWTDIKQHVELLQILIDHELNRFKGQTTEWSGKLPSTAETILHQHAIQGDITEIQRHMCRWIAYSKKHLERTLTHRLLLSITEQLENAWQPTSLSRDENDMLREAFTLFINHCFKQLAKIRELFPAANRLANERLEQILTIVAKLYQMDVFRHCCPFQNSLQYELSLIIKAGTVEWLERMINNVTRPKLSSDEETLKNMIELVYIVIADAHSAVKFYNPIFESTVKMAFYHISFRKIDEKLMNLIVKALEEELGERIYQSPAKLLENLEPDSADILAFASAAEQTSLVLFELYLALSELSKYKIYVNESHRSTLKIGQFYIYFGVAVRKWIIVCRNKLLQRIEFLLDKDQQDGSASNQKYSPSAFDISQCFTQMTQFWRRLAWPDVADAILFLLQLIEDLANATRRYASLNEEKLNSKKFYESNEISIVVNNIERIRGSFLNLPMEFAAEKLFSIAEKLQPTPQIEESRRKFDNLIRTCNDEVVHRIYQILTKVVMNFQSELKQNLVHLIDAPESSEIDESIEPLFNCLHDQLAPFRDYLIPENSSRLFELFWNLIVDEIHSEIQDSTLIRSISSYGRTFKGFELIFDYFKNDENGLTKETLKNEKYRLVKKLLKYHSMETCALIKFYYQEKLQEQERANNTNHSELGRIYCRAYYHPKRETLYVEVVSCKNLKSCDSNGFSDPYVEVFIRPNFLFSHLEKQQTSVEKKTLNPQFNEKFEFRLTQKEVQTAGTIIHFIVMDHDLVWSNDFEGEAFLEINKLSGISVEQSNENRTVDELKVFELALTHPKAVQSRIMDVLEYRTNDKIAMEFVRRRREEEKQ